jgi:YggT family protein
MIGPGTLIAILCYALLAAILLRIVFSYVEGPFPRNSLHRLAFDVTEPFLRPIRNVLPPTAGFDFSPTIVMIVLFLIIGLVH